MAFNKDAAPAAAQAKVVAERFVDKYYSILVNDRAKLHRFYCEESVFVHSEGSKEHEPVTGLEAIKHAINAMPTVVAVDPARCSFDVQASNNGAVVLLVTGVMTVKRPASEEAVERMFAQNFFLAQQVSHKANYFVMNDAFRFLVVPGASKVVSQAPKPAPPQKQDVDVKAAAKPAPQLQVVKEEVAAQKPVAEATPTPAPVPAAPLAATDEVPAAQQDEEASLPAKPAGGSMTWAQLASKGVPGSKPPAAPQASTEEPAVKVPDAPKSTEERPAEKPVTTIFVKGSIGDVTEDQLLAQFGGHGTIKSISVREARGYACIEYEQPDSVTKALESRTVKIGETELNVEPRHSRPAGATNRGRGRGRGRGHRGDYAGRDSAERGRGGRGHRGRGRRGPGGQQPN